MKTGISLLVAVVLSMIVSHARADCGKDPECDAPSAWNEFTAASLTMTQPGEPGIARWRGVFDHKSFDFTIDMDVQSPGYAVKGVAGMVGGRVMITKGLKLQRGTEIDVIDGPILEMRLAMIVLGRALPNGPAALEGRVPIDYEGKVGIRYATPSAGGYVAPPWRASGYVQKLASGAVAFDLLLTMPAGGTDKAKTITQKFAGEFSSRTQPVFDDRMSLGGWTLYGVGPEVEQQGGSTKLDYGAKPATGPRVKTIADVRAKIAEENDPGKPDRSRDFTGFWKEKCEEPFGLQVKHFGDDGKYSIVFCGPGGCGDPAGSRLTFITGDRNYQVVSEDEIVEIRASGKNQRMVRCTKETNPVLNYRSDKKR